VNSLSCHGRGASVTRQKFISIARDIIETIGDGFCAFDREWKFVYVNLRACEMWGLTPDTLIGRNFWDVLPELTGTDAETFLRNAVEANTGSSTRPSRQRLRAGYACVSARYQEH
jgi:PAS domain S-box-containing protein